jgi:hypothetical protein
MKTPEPAMLCTYSCSNSESMIDCRNRPWRPVLAPTSSMPCTCAPDTLLLFAGPACVPVRPLIVSRSPVAPSIWRSTVLRRPCPCIVSPAYPKGEPDGACAGIVA